MELKELIAVSSDDTLRFFYSGLRETEAGRNLPGFETLYLASVLANYAQYSVGADTRDPTPPEDLVQVFDQFIIPTETFRDDVEILHLAASQCLFMLGFFSEQMKKRHNVRWFETYGRGYYLKLSHHSATQSEKKLFWKVSRDFSQCVAACQELQANCHDARFLIR